MGRWEVFIYLFIVTACAKSRGGSVGPRTPGAQSCGRGSLLALVFLVGSLACLLNKKKGGGASCFLPSPKPQQELYRGRIDTGNWEKSGGLKRAVPG